MRETQFDALAMGTALNDRYVIGKVIGSGGFGIIYLAYDTDSERKVAVKEYFPVGTAVRIPDRITIDAISYRYEDDFIKGRERFFNETEILLHLGSSTDVIKVYDVFAANGTVYYVMEYVDGLSVAEYIKKYGRISAEQALFAALKISSAFTLIHEKNIIHRDLSPENIMITADGNVRIVDFGNARPFSYDEGNSLTVALKPGYAPLEQYQHYGSQGPWTDIYSLGAVLYYALTLNDPCDPMTRIEDDSELRAGLSSVNPQLAGIIRKMVEIKPDERYADDRELLSDLKKVRLTAKKFKDSYDN